WHDLDAEATGMLDHTGDLLGAVGPVVVDLAGAVVSLIASAGQDVVVPAVIRTRQLRPDLDEPLIPRHREAPAGVVGEMPVEAVESVAGHELEQLMDEIHIPARARGVEHQPSPGV